MKIFVAGSLHLAALFSVENWLSWNQSAVHVVSSQLGGYRPHPPAIAAAAAAAAAVRTASVAGEPAYL